MKKLTAAIALTIAAATAVTAFSGCNIIKSLLPFGKNEPTNAPVTTVAATTAPATTQAATTEPPTVAKQTEAPAATTRKPEESSNTSEYPSQLDGGFYLVTTPTCASATLGINFTVPEWQNKVYCKNGNSNRGFYFEFYEASNLINGIEKYGFDSMGLLFAVYATDTEANGDIEYPAGSIVLNGEKKYLTYFKPTDVRFDTEDKTLQQNYQDAYQYQRDYFQSGVVREDMQYSPSAHTNSVNLKSN
nr:hypothetical protein [uncultured Ruminococcus sp.]